MANRKVTISINIIDTIPEVKDNYGKVTENSKILRPLEVTIEADSVLEAKNKVASLLGVYVEAPE